MHFLPVEDLPRASFIPHQRIPAARFLFLQEGRQLFGGKIRPDQNHLSRQPRIFQRCRLEHSRQTGRGCLLLGIGDDNLNEYLVLPIASQERLDALEARRGDVAVAFGDIPLFQIQRNAVRTAKQRGQLLSICGRPVA